MRCASLLLALLLVAAAAANAPPSAKEGSPVDSVEPSFETVEASPESEGSPEDSVEPSFETVEASPESEGSPEDSVEPSFETVEASPESEGSPEDSVEPSFETVEASPESEGSSEDSVEPSFETVEASPEDSVEPSFETVEASPEDSVEPSFETVEASPESEGSPEDSVEPSFETVEASPESEGSPEDSVEPSYESVEPSSESKEDSPESVEESVSVEDSPETEEDSHEFELVLAETCDAEACQLPYCRCSSTNIPGGLAPRDTPQFVLVTFDGGVTVVNIVTYRDVLYSRVNRNQCPIGATFFINHEYSNYQVANELYNNGFEIGLNSVTRRFPQSYWAQATYDILKEEIADQRVQMAHFANIPIDEINGVRMPFLQMAGNNSFHVMKDFGLTYDASWPTNLFRNPGMWPYTLDYASVQDCQIHPCPTASIPGVWVLPIVTWLDLEGFSCYSLEACIFAPDREDEQAWFEFILTNFERHYLNNRAPFSFNINEAYMTAFPAVARAYVRFFNLINSLPDVFMVNSGEVIDWVKNPISIPEYVEKPCKVFTPTQCPASTCVLFNEQTQQQTPHWFQICNVCPRTYPWLGNPLGQ